MSPQGIYIGLSIDELNAIMVSARARILNGDRIGLSGAAKSSTKNYSMSASDMLREAQYALNQITGQGLPMRTYFDAARAGRWYGRGC